MLFKITTRLLAFPLAVFFLAVGLINAARTRY